MKVAYWSVPTSCLNLIGFEKGLLSFKEIVIVMDSRVATSLQMCIPVWLSKS